MKSNIIVLISAVAGIICGLASLTSLLAGQWFNLVVWAIVGAIILVLVLSMIRRPYRRRRAL